MKNIVSIIILTFLFLTGCSDFLTEENKSNVTAEEFYLTEEGYQALINANYADLRDIYADQPWLFIGGTDMYSEGRDPGPDGLTKYTQLTPSSSGVDHLYNNCYQAIQKANMALYYADLTEPVDNINELIGEIKYLRAQAYFLLVQTYGGVPLINEYIAEAVTEFDRASAEAIYGQILLDLADALNSVGTGAYEGHVTQRAVQHLLAKVYLTRAYESFGASSDFDDAASYADAAIGGQGLDIPFADLWDPANNDRNDEVIFSVQFNPGSVSSDILNLGNAQQNNFGSYTGGSEVAGDAPYKNYATCPNRYTLNLFEQNDERYEATFMVEVYERYLDYFDVEDKSGLTVAHFYEPQWFTDADRTAYEAAHPDLGQYHEWGTYDPEGADISNNYGIIIVKKFDDPEAPFASGGARRTSRRDFVVSRLGETYLIAAEAYLGAGNTTTALERINEVRLRAGVSDITSIDIEAILDERGRELLGEYHRWFDLKRTGTLVERTSMYNKEIEEANFAGNNGELKILRPIPQSALDLNQNQDFPQNPAYN